MTELIINSNINTCFCVLNDMYVTINYLSDKKKESFMLEKGLEYDDITDAIFQDDELQMSQFKTGKLVLTVVDGDGWENTLVDGRSEAETDPLHSCPLTVTELRDGAELRVRLREARCGPRTLLQGLLSRAAPVPRGRLRYLLGAGYCGCRLLRSDGNDYYRAAYFALLEALLARRRLGTLRLLRQRLHNLLSELHCDGAAVADSSLHKLDQTIVYLNEVMKVLEEAAGNL